jgi:hypothetical protein
MERLSIKTSYLCPCIASNARFNINQNNNKMKTRLLPVLLFLGAIPSLYAQTYKPNLHDKAQLSVDGRSVSFKEENGRKAIRVEEGEGANILLFNNIGFTNGTIEFDCKGRNVIGRSFLGLAFHVQNDSTYDAIYFRPFNFSNPDTVRRWRAVQYISHPKYPWDKLRQEFPGKYENKVNPVPDGDEWFHCKITVKEKVISVFVNNSGKPSLVVNKLTTTTTGKIGLWIENGSTASFANVEIRNEKK